MTKKYCDLCEAPVPENGPALETKTPWGKKYLGVDVGSTTNSMKQCVITTSVRFGFLQHRAGFGGPPDLCNVCMKKLIQELADQIKT